MLRTFSGFLAVLLLLGTVVFAEGSGTGDPAAMVVGWWEEYSPSSNIVHFSHDGTVQLLLKKGEVGDLHSLDGTWRISHDGVLHIVFSLSGRTLARDARISFKNDEMILTEAEGTETRHRRHSGVLPGEFTW